MALLHRNFAKLHALAANTCSRGLKVAHSAKEKQIKKSVFISQATDVYTNLALENWMYKNFDFTNHHVLMLYLNDPSVVMGKNQNPWVEANLSGLSDISENGVKLARRSSGGSTIYNDKGVLNMTFFTPRNRYNGTYNLEVITRAIFRKFNLKMDISPRNNLSVHNINVSATGAEIGADNAYQHCSMLIDANKINLMDALYKDECEIQTKAVKSSKSKFLNLAEIDPKINVDNILSAVGWEYMRTPAFSLKDGGVELANQQMGFQKVNPTEKWFPGITEIRENLLNWDWCYGKTPKFTISMPFTGKSRHDLRVTLNVENGIVGDVTLYIPPGLSRSGFTGEADVISSLKGQTFSESLLKSIKQYLAIGNIYHNRERTGNDFIRQAMISM